MGKREQGKVPGPRPWKVPGVNSGSRENTGPGLLFWSHLPFHRRQGPGSPWPSMSLQNLGRVPRLGLASVSHPCSGMVTPAQWSRMGSPVRVWCWEGWVPTWVRPHEDWAGKAMWEKIPPVCGPGWSRSCAKTEWAHHHGQAGWARLWREQGPAGTWEWRGQCWPLQPPCGFAALLSRTLACFKTRQNQGTLEPWRVQHGSVWES